MCFQQTRIKSPAANAVIDTITSNGIVIASCATDLKTIVWLSRMDGKSMDDYKRKLYILFYCICNPKSSINTSEERERDNEPCTRTDYMRLISWIHPCGSGTYIISNYL
jgi:hypothetical protein